MHVYLKNHEWYLAKQKDNELRIYGKDFTGKHNTFFGVNGVVVPCGEKVESTFNVDSVESLLRASSTIRISGAIRVMQNGSETTDVCAEGVANYKVKINGKVVYANDKYSYRWDDHSTHLEENFFDIPTDCFNKGENIVEIDNNGEEIVVLVQMLRIFIQPLQHLDVLRCPKWAVVGKPFSIKIYTETPTPLSIICTGARVVSPSGKYYMENNPLGRAEWIKLYGYLLGVPEMADSIFAEIESNYNSLKNQVAQAIAAGKERPTMISEKKYGNSWGVPGGLSYISVLAFLHLIFLIDPMLQVCYNLGLHLYRARKLLFHL
jgi:hypothetical protein